MTITRAFGFTFDPQTGAVERWASGDPASVAEHLPIAQDDGIGFNGEDPRCNDGRAACEGCLMIGYCIGDYPAHPAGASA